MGKYQSSSWKRAEEHSEEHQRSKKYRLKRIQSRSCMFPSISGIFYGFHHRFQCTPQKDTCHYTSLKKTAVYWNIHSKSISCIVSEFRSKSHMGTHKRRTLRRRNRNKRGQTFQICSCLSTSQCQSEECGYWLS